MPDVGGLSAAWLVRLEEGTTKWGDERQAHRWFLGVPTWSNIMCVLAVRTMEHSLPRLSQQLESLQVMFAGISTSWQDESGTTYCHCRWR